MRDEHVTTETLIDYLHHELSAEDDAHVHVHLAQCAPCRGGYEAQAQLSERLRAFARSEERELPARVLFGVREQIARRRGPAWLRFDAVLRPAVGLPVAAAIVLAAAVGFSSLHPSLTHAPSVAAAYYLDDHAALSNRLMPLSQPAAVPATLTNTQASQSANVASNPASIDASMIASE
jgi:predicted anti-sigma-YlaC factor YlaD